jgi:macrodomain Ter protein organizer (MatP/YcbG family)
MTIKPADFQIAIPALRRARDRLGLSAAVFLQLSAVKTPAELNDWISDNLSEAEAARLDNTLRQARWRRRHSNAYTRLIINRDTAKALRAKAKESGSTVNQFLQHITHNQGITP